MLFRPKLLLYTFLGLFLSLVVSATFLLPSDRLHATEPQTSTIPTISLNQNVQKIVLDNGLTVLTKEVHSAPVVTVQIWYRVGSRNEEPGMNGIAHQLEHLLFKGTKERPIQFGRLFSALGSQSNAFTTYDQTAYFGTVERDKLEALLVLEADRMENAAIAPDQLTSEKRVVISEVQGYENSPNYRLSKAVMRAAFPNRAYGLPIGGTKADVEKFTVEQVRRYYHRYYTPDNATLVIVGDFATASTLQNIQEIFGKIPKLPVTISAPLPTPVLSLAVATSKPPILLKEPGSTPILNAVYPLPDINHPDVPAIDVLDMIFSGGRSSRLYQAVVETGLASYAYGSASALLEPGWYTIGAIASPGQSLSKIDSAIQQVISDLQKKPVSPEELNRAKFKLQTNFVLNNEDVTSQAFQLGYNQTTAGDYRYSDRYLAGINQVTAADVQRVAQTYLAPQLRTVGFFEPTVTDGKTGTANSGSGISENFSPGKPVDPAEVAKYLPLIQPSEGDRPLSLPGEITLSNGLRVLLLPDPSVPTINLSGKIPAGSEFDSLSKAGLANLTAANLMNGTKTSNALTLAKTLENRSVHLGFGAGRERVIIYGNSLATELPLMLQVLTDVIQNSTFPEDKLELTRQRALTALKLELDSPWGLGRRIFNQAIYPKNHPFYTFPTEESLKGITRADVQQFYRQYYRPDGTVLALVGDFDPGKVRSLLENSLGKWQVPGKPPQLKFPPVDLPKSINRLEQVIPGKTESITYIGYQGISRKDPRYYAAKVMNQILGGDTLSSRLGTEIRDRQGLTYGIYSTFAAGREPGLFFISMQTAPEDTQKAIASTLALLKQLREQGITTAELNAAKRAITSSYPVDLASPGSLAGAILNNAVYGLNREEIQQFIQRINAVSLKDVQQAIQQLIHPDNLVIVTAGPGTKLKN
jgi:zinc protease